MDVFVEKVACITLNAAKTIVSPLSDLFRRLVTKIEQVTRNPAY